MFSYKRFLLTAAVIAGSLDVSVAQAETLQDAMRAALANHPAIEIARMQKEIAEQGVREQKSNLFPEISTNASAGRMFADTSTTRGLTVSRGEAYSWLWEGSATLTQPLFNGFETYRRIDAAEAREQSADLTITDVKQAIALRAAQAYFNVLRAQDAFEKAKSYQGKIEDYLQRISSMVEAGAADEAEAAQAKNIQSQLETTVAEMEGSLKLALADYAEATGSMPTGPLEKGEQPDVGAAYADIEQALAHAKANHPLVVSSLKNLEAETEEIQAEKAVLYPDVNGELSYLERDQKEEIGGEVIDGRALMRLNWSFSTGGGQYARIRKAKAERSEALARNAQVQRDIERDIRRAFAELETAKKQKELSENRAKVTQDLFKTYEQQFEASKVRILQLMQAENQVFTSELEQINAFYRVLLANYTLSASVGTLLETLEPQKQTISTPPETGVSSGEAVENDVTAAVDPVAVEQAVRDIEFFPEQSK